jgi:protoporphyrinogen oxidase
VLALRPADETNRRMTAKHVVIIGAGFTGLAAAWELTRAGCGVTVVESDSDVGGLAGSFDVGGHRLERFYHHWFTNDRHIVELVRALGCEHQIVARPSRTGLYYNRSHFRLSTPLDLLRFTPLSLMNRARLGLLLFKVRGVRDWRAIEHLNVREWLVPLCGAEVYRVVWEPLLKAKFSIHAEELAATWFWKKLQLRGHSRSKGGAEMLAYYRGGFAALANMLRRAIEEKGGRLLLNTRAQRVRAENGRVAAVETSAGSLAADEVLATCALPEIADLVAGAVDAAFLERLRRVRYLANKCLVLELDRSLSGSYWLNVTDPTFPFVGVIEHTNFEPPESYGGRHIVYLSRYLPADDPLYALEGEAFLDYALPHIQRMFPGFERRWILGHHVWTARYAQPVTERNYSRYVPGHETPLANFTIATMAQIYPEDRGTNYAVRDGRAVAAKLLERLR